MREPLRHLLVALAAVLAIALPRPGLAAEPGVTHVFLLIGQSNMAGRGIVEASDTALHPRVWTLAKDRSWRPASDPLHFDKPAIAGVGPGLTLGRCVADRHPAWVVGLVPAAFGGSSLDEWKPGSPNYENAVARARIALAGGARLAGILWHQGESDDTPALAATYPERFAALVAALRRDLAAPDVPVLVGTIGPFSPAAPRMNPVLSGLPGVVARCSVVSADGLTGAKDHLHFDAASARELGRRYATAFEELQARSR
jgi:Carbohydrate esterase, sialic acid-specific acetylesterase